MRALSGNKNKTRDLTHGPIGKQLFWFSLPLFAGSLIQQLYSTVDLIFVGRILGKDAAAAVGASTFLVICILGFFIGLSVGIGVIAAREFARGEYGELHRIVHCTAGLTIIFSIVFTILGLVLAPTILEWMNTPPEIMHQGTVYIRVFLLSLFSIVSYNVGSGILRALGNSLSPMIYQLIGGIANVLGNLLFVYYWNFGITGSAMATVVSQTLAAGLVIFHLYNMDERYRLRFKQIYLDWPLSREIFRIGIPAAIQTIVITLSNIVVQTNINGLGVNSIAAYAAYFKVENVIYLPIMAIGQACSTFISQNVGVGKIMRSKRGTTVSIYFGLIVTAISISTVLYFADFAFSLFTSDPDVIAIGSGIAFVIMPFYFLYVFLEVLASSIRGSGSTLPTMFIILVNMCLIRIGVLKLIMYFSPTATSVAWVYPITWVFTVASLYWYYKSERWNPVKIIAKPEAAQ